MVPRAGPTWLGAADSGSVQLHSASAEPRAVSGAGHHLLQHRAAGTKSPRCQSVFPPDQQQMVVMYGITSMVGLVTSRSPRRRHQPRGPAGQSRCNPNGIWIPQCGITPNTTPGGTTKGLVRSCVAPRQAAPSPVLPACGHPILSSHQPLPKGIAWLCSALELCSVPGAGTRHSSAPAAENQGQAEKGSSSGASSAPVPRAGSAGDRMPNQPDTQAQEQPYSTIRTIRGHH